MLTLVEAVASGPVSIYYLGTQEQLLAELPDSASFADTHDVNVEFYKTEAALVADLYEQNLSSPVIVYGLFSYLQARHRLNSDHIVGLVGSIASSRVQVRYGDRIEVPLVDFLVARQGPMSL